MNLTPEEFEAERDYQVLMHFMKQMLVEGIVSEKFFDKMEHKIRGKYSPKTGDLLIRKDLLFPSNRVMNTNGKEVPLPNENQND